MALKWDLSKVRIALLLAISVILLFLFSTLIEMIFNTKEINLLVEKADENNLDYELVIHNPLTNSYSFSIKE